MLTLIKNVTPIGRNIMRKYTPLIVFLGALASCTVEPLPQIGPDLVREIRAYDLGNIGNGSDIRVDFDVQNNLNVREYRIMVFPTNSSTSFNVAIASKLGPASYVAVLPVPIEDRYSVKRLTSGLLDVNGNPIQNRLEYVVAILVEGIGNFQLSEFSRPFTLKDQAIYAGYYEGRDCCNNVKSTIKFSGGKYRGPHIWVQGDITLAEFSFIITETDSVKEFIWNLNVACIEAFNNCTTRPEICTAEYIGSGTLSDELVLVIFAFALGGGNCELGEDLPLTLRRQ